MTPTNRSIVDLEKIALHLQQNSSGSTAPSAPHAEDRWLDTSSSPARPMRRNSDNTAWVDVKTSQ